MKIIGSHRYLFVHLAGPSLIKRSGLPETPLSPVLIQKETWHGSTSLTLCRKSLTTTRQNQVLKYSQGRSVGICFWLLEHTTPEARKNKRSFWFQHEGQRNSTEWYPSKWTDLNNCLVGVLLRFRRQQIAVTADVEQMFYGFKVREDHHHILQFLWYKDNDPDKEITDYWMTVHMFRNSLASAVATYEECSRTWRDWTRCRCKAFGLQKFICRRWTRLSGQEGWSYQSSAVNLIWSPEVKGQGGVAEN